MPTLKFRLRTDGRIALIYSHNGKETFLSTGRKVQPMYWNDKSGNWISPKYGEAQPTFNLALKAILSKAEKAQDRFFLDNGTYPTGQQLRELIEGKQDQAKQFFPLFRQFVNYQCRERGYNNVSSGTMLNYENVKEHLTAYGEYCKTPFSFDSIDTNFFNKYTAYQTDVKKNGVSTIGSQIKVLKTFLNWCIDKNEYPIQPSIIATLKVTSEDNFKAYLIKSELDTLLSLRLTNLMHTRVRDAFCLQCCIGCRYSDLEKMVSQNLIWENDKWFVVMRTKKNQKQVKTPLSKRAYSIVEKYKGTHPKDWIPSSHDMNVYIKEVCEIAGINQEIVLTEGTGNYRKEVVYKKSQLISTHSAVRTCINLMIAEQVSDATIASMVGKSIKTIQTYKHSDTSDSEKAIERFDSDYTGEKNYFLRIA